MVELVLALGINKITLIKLKLSLFRKLGFFVSFNFFFFHHLLALFCSLNVTVLPWLLVIIQSMYLNFLYALFWNAFFIFLLSFFKLPSKCIIFMFGLIVYLLSHNGVYKNYCYFFINWANEDLTRNQKTNCKRNSLVSNPASDPFSSRLESIMPINKNFIDQFYIWFRQD